MKRLSTLFAACAAFSAFAQPTLTTSWAPTVGTTVHITAYDGSAGLSEGASGANVTWDLSAYDTLGSQDVRFITPSSAPGGANFGTATDCAEGLSTNNNNTYTFSRLNGNIYQLVGVSQPASTYILNYSPAQDILHFPTTYNSSFVNNSSAAGTFSVNGYSGTTVRHVLDSTIADGYGTLITRAGTFTNVLRLYVSQHIVDTQMVAGQTAVTTYYYKTYNWMSPAHPGTGLATISHMETTQSGFTQSRDGGNYSKISPAGINDISVAGIEGLAILPQPAGDNATIILQNTQAASQITVTVYDLSGREVQSLVQTLTAGENHLPVNTTALSNGLYTVMLRSGEHATALKLSVAH
ncbi:MAG: T9SS type A sorting domain-containing protein [Bacteroidetes bacterium]|nr:T9SS type A sorting domain-containing protein [Bacteroidota bacterium]